MHGEWDVMGAGAVCCGLERMQSLSLASGAGICKYKQTVNFCVGIEMICEYL